MATDFDIKRPDVAGNDRYKLGPVARDDVYCSPWCGAQCKRADYDNAVLAAEDLCARMGKGWEPHIYENGRWFYTVKKGCVTIRKDDDRYSAWIEPKINVGGGQIKTAVQFIEYADAPEDALGFATQAARTHVARLNQALEDVLA